MIFWRVIAVLAFLVFLSIETQLRKIAEYFEKRTELADAAIKFGKVVFLERRKRYGNDKNKQNRD